MKFFTLLCFTTFMAASVFAQDTIPNPGMESWVNHGTYMDPSNWTTLNPLTAGIGATTCAQSTSDVHSGSYAVKLTTKSLGNVMVPAILTTGNIDVATQNVVGGIPIASRPLALNGWYKYTPSGTDTALIEIRLSNGQTQIGLGQQFVTANAWTSFSVPVTYSAGSTPDTVRITFNSSATDTPHVNSTLLLDDLSYSYTSGIQESTIQQLNMYPNPAYGQVIIDNREMRATTMMVYACDGKLEKSIALTDDVNELDVTKLPKGFHLMQATGKDGLIYRSRLVVQ